MRKLLIAVSLPYALIFDGSVNVSGIARSNIIESTMMDIWLAADACLNTWLKHNCGHSSAF
jgi:hypothetical protein